MNKQLLVSLLGVFLVFNTYAQNECEVVKEGINDIYKGECKKGVAHGDGVSEGSLGKYEGSFKKGFPHGQGKLTYSEGVYYEGEWKFGDRDGEGKMIFSPDSIQDGYWEDDLFIGKYKYPYKITSTYGPIRVSLKKMSDSGERVDIVFMRNGQRTMSDVTSLNCQGDSGSYQEGQFLGYTGVTFPFIGKVDGTVNNVLRTAQNLITLKYEIYEPGIWQVVIHY